MRSRWSNKDLACVVNNHIVDYPTPGNLSYGWSLGSLTGLSLVVQILTGIFVAMHYSSDVTLAFSSVEHIMRDVNGGWVLRYVHANCASVFFIVAYVHMMRGLYYRSYEKPRGLLWASGVIVFLIMVITAFIGYVLPFGQMSLWGSIVITNLASVVPFIGSDIVEWIWGGYAVDKATLSRFYSLHYLLPFVIVGLVLVHLLLLHRSGSSNRLGISSKVDSISFYPYCYVKDLFVFLAVLLLLSALAYFTPNALGHSDNYIAANPLVTPAHIVPEWYFLVFYGILRSVSYKALGVVLMLSSIIVLGFLGSLSSSETRSGAMTVLGRKSYWVFIGACVTLGVLGSLPAEEPYVGVLTLATFVYFSYLLVGVSQLGVLESSAVRHG